MLDHHKAGRLAGVRLQLLEVRWPSGRVGEVARANIRAAEVGAADCCRCRRARLPHISSAAAVHAAASGGCRLHGPGGDYQGLLGLRAVVSAVAPRRRLVWRPEAPVNKHSVANKL